jgi:hypothetical protein
MRKRQITEDRAEAELTEEQLKTVAGGFAGLLARVPPSTPASGSSPEDSTTIQAKAGAQGA